MIYICKVSAVNYEDGVIDVKIPELEDKVKTKVLMLAGAYEMPDVDDTVAVLFDSEECIMTRGICLGKIWNSKNKPKEPDEGLYRKELPDGNVIKSKDKKLEIESEALYANTDGIRLAAGSAFISIENGAVMAGNGSETVKIV